MTMPSLSDYFILQNLLLLAVAVAVPLALALFAARINRHGKAELSEGFRAAVRDINERFYSQKARGRKTAP